MTRLVGFGISLCGGMVTVLVYRERGVAGAIVAFGCAIAARVAWAWLVER